MAQLSRDSSNHVWHSAQGLRVALDVERSGRPRDGVLVRACIFAGAWSVIRCPQECRHNSMESIQKHRAWYPLLLDRSRHSVALASQRARFQSILSTTSRLIQRRVTSFFEFGLSSPPWMA